MSLTEYLAAEEKAAEQSRHEYATEIELFSDLTHFYERLGRATKSPHKLSRLTNGLFLVVLDQMHGVVSQMLRRRLTDAEGLTRRAIEVTATAYLLWKSPGLAPVYVGAYPNVNKTGDPKQWEPSSKYREEFSTRKLFSQLKGISERLQEYYKLFSAMASHAGPGSLVGQVERGKKVYKDFLATNEENIRRMWYSLLGAYVEMLRVFLDLFGAGSSNREMRAVQKDFEEWTQKAETMRRVRTP